MTGMCDHPLEVRLCRHALSQSSRRRRRARRCAVRIAQLQGAALRVYLQADVEQPDEQTLEQNIHVPTTVQQEIATAPRVLLLADLLWSADVRGPVDHIVEAPAPLTQEELIYEPPTLQQARPGLLVSQVPLAARQAQFLEERRLTSLVPTHTESSGSPTELSVETSDEKAVTDSEEAEVPVDRTVLSDYMLEVPESMREDVTHEEHDTEVELAVPTTLPVALGPPAKPLLLVEHLLPPADLVPPAVPILPAEPEEAFAGEDEDDDEETGSDESDESDESKESEVEAESVQSAEASIPTDAALHADPSPHPGQAPGWWARGVIPAGWWGCRSCGYAVATRGACCAVCLQQERQEELGYCEECDRGLTPEEAEEADDCVSLCFTCARRR